MARRIKFEFVGDTSQLEGSLDGLQRDSDELGGSFDDTFNKKGAGGAVAAAKQFVKAHPALVALGAAAAALGVALFKASQATVEFAAKADTIAKKARAIGTSAEDLQIMQGALELGGVAAETTANAIQKLSVNLGMAAKGSKMQAEALEDLNLTFEQLEAVPLDEKMALIADGMVAMTSQSKRAQAAQALLGRGAMDMLAAFDEGGDAIRKSSEMVKAAGIISNETAKESEFLTDAVTIATRQWARLKDGALEPLIPVVTVMVTKLGNLFQVLSDTGVLQATAEAVAFVAEKFIGLTDEVERFKSETSEAAAVQNDSSSTLEEYRGRVEKLKGIIAEARAEQKELNDQVRLKGPWVDAEKNIARVAQIEKELAHLGQTMYEDGKTHRGERINALQQLRIATQIVKGEEERLARARKEATDAAASAAESERELEEARAEAAEAEKKRETKRAAYRAAAAAGTAALIAASDAWAQASRQAEDDRLEGLDAIIRQEERAIEKVWDEANAVIEAGSLSAAKKEEMFVDAERRIDDIREEFKRKKLDSIDEESEAYGEALEADVEAARQAALAKADAEFKYRQAVQEASRTHYEQLEEAYNADMEVVSEVTAQVQQIHEAVFGAILDVAQHVFDEKAQAYQETANRINDIDSLLEEEMSANARRQLEEEKAKLEEQSALEKEAALEAFERQKALSIVNATIATALAVIQALATAPNIIVGIVLAIAAGVAGAVSIASIASQQPPQLHSGGMVPALGAASQAGDEMMIRARRGEAVLSPQGVSAAGGEQGVAALNRGSSSAGGGTTVNLIRVGPRTTEAIMHDTLRVPSSRLSRAIGSVRPRVGRHDPRSRKV
ncbi:hypothetical protein CMI37_06345 [Candidatus Pacearchaeota archaeon]|nr:hypothetical protein [Candidatus Pacearchaeota archaeon]